MNNCLIAWLQNHFPDWKFTSRYPDIDEREPEDVPPSLEVCEKPFKPSDKLKEGFNMVYFIDGARHIDVFATVESLNEPNSIAYPIAIGQSSVVACKLDTITHSFKRAITPLRKIVISLPDVIVKEPTPINDWLSPDLTVNMVGYETKRAERTEGAESLFGAAKKIIHSIMREDENAALFECLEDSEPEKLIIIDGHFQTNSELTYKSPVLSIDKSYDYPSLRKEIRTELSILRESMETYYTSPVLKYETKDEPQKTIWYVRLRDHDHFKDKSALTAEAGIVECALLGDFTTTEEDKAVVRECSNLIRELANPTCYGLDEKRWRMHLYHMYLTEQMCKQLYINESYLMSRVYGK